MTRIDVDQLNAITSPPQRATEVFRSEFDAAWEFGALWISVWHPALSGRLARFKAVLELLHYMHAKSGVWFARLDQICDHMQKPMAEGRWITALRDVPDIRKPGPRIPQRPVNRGGGAPRARDHFSPDA